MIQPAASPSFGERLKYRRRLLDLTQGELAERAGCARVTIHKLETDELRPSKQLAELLAEALQVPAAERPAFVEFARSGYAADVPLASASTGPHPPSNLPASLTSFIGRIAETSEVKRLLAGTRLLTLTGTGGTGKTRLSLQVASDLLDQFPDGAWFLELAPLADPAIVPHAIATALGVREEAGRPVLATLIDHVRSKQLLLVLDNCEHLIEACARAAAALLAEATAVQILASSREALGIAGEAIYHVPSLSIPSQQNSVRASDVAQYDSVRLFVERAAAVRSTFKLTADNAPAVAQICAHLDGIPLAIELAAARIKVLRAEEIAQRLDDRFRLLTGGSRSALPRQQTLRATIDWSYSLLTEQERLLLSRLSVFAGGWTLAAAEAVCVGDGIAGEEILDLLTRLVDKSLVVVADSVIDTRYHLLDTVRQYAREKLLAVGEDTRFRDLHLAFCVRLTEEFSIEALGPGVAGWLTRLDTEIDNIRGALAWSLESREFLSGMRIACAMRNFWVQRHTEEGLAYLREILARSETIEPGAARANALRELGLLEYWQGDYSAAQRSYGEALPIARGAGTGRAIAVLLRSMGETAGAQKDYVAGRALLTEAFEIFRKSDDTRGTANTLESLANLAMSEGKADEANALYEDSVSRQRILGITDNIAIAIRRLGQIALQRGDYQKAAKHFQESLTSNMQVGDNRGTAACLAAFAALLAARGKSLDAVRLCGAVHTLLDEWHTRMLPIDQDLYERGTTALRTQFDAATFDAAESEGRAMTMEQAIAVALEGTTAGTTS